TCPCSRTWTATASPTAHSPRKTARPRRAWPRRRSRPTAAPAEPGLPPGPQAGAGPPVARCWQNGRPPVPAGIPMRLSRFHLHTTKETPADAELASHKLMLRSGMIRKLATGLYTWTPLGLRVLRKVEAVVREEMDRAGAVE